MASITPLEEEEEGGVVGEEEEEGGVVEEGGGQAALECSHFSLPFVYISFAFFCFCSLPYFSGRSCAKGGGEPYYDDMHCDTSWGGAGLGQDSGKHVKKTAAAMAIT